VGQSCGTLLQAALELESWVARKWIPHATYFITGKRDSNDGRQDNPYRLRLPGL